MVEGKFFVGEVGGAVDVWASVVVADEVGKVNACRYFVANTEKDVRRGRLTTPYG